MTSTSSLSNSYLEQWQKVQQHNLQPAAPDKKTKSEISAIMRCGNIRLNFDTTMTAHKVKSLLKALISVMENVSIGFDSHIITLINLEKCFRKSETYTYQISLSIFQEHLEQIKKIGFEIDTLYCKTDAFTKDGFKGPNATFLGIATRRKCPVLVEALIKAGANVNLGRTYSYWSPWEENRHTCSPLFLLIKQHYGDRDLSYKDQIDVSYMDQCVRILTENGCNPNECDTNMQPLLRKAISYKNLNLAKSLVKAKADINLMHPDTIAAGKMISIFENVGPKQMQIVMQLGAELFANDSVKTILNSPPKCNLEHTYCILYNASIAYVRYTEDNLLEFIPKSLVRIVGEYLNLPLDFGTLFCIPKPKELFVLK